MSTAKKAYARYYIVRGQQTMWRGEPSEAGSLVREFLITSNEFTSTQGTFQVYGLEGASGGISDGRLVTSGGELTVLFDKDFNGLDSTAKQFRQLIEEAGQGGFRQVTTWEILDFEDKLRRSRQGR